MILTIGIVVYNEEKNIPLVEKNISRINHQLGRQCRIIVIDNASTDSTLQKLRELRRRLQFDIYSRSLNHLGEARADVVSLAQTPWVGFIDADTLISETWCEELLIQMQNEDEKVAAIGGPLSPAGEESGLYRRIFAHFMGSLNSPQVRMYLRPQQVQHIATANVIYRRRALIDAGSFSERFQYVGEDLDLSYKLRERGYKLMMVPALSVEHRLPSHLRQWEKKALSYGKGRGRVSYHHGDYFSTSVLFPLVFAVFISLVILTFPQLYGVPFFLYGTSLWLMFHFASKGHEKLGFRDSVKQTHWTVLTHLFYSLGIILGSLQGFKDRWEKPVESPQRERWVAIHDEALNLRASSHLPKVSPKNAEKNAEKNESRVMA